jgi:hypothetical protein
MRVLSAAAMLLAAFAVASCKPVAPPTKAYAYPPWGFKASFQAPPTGTNQPGSPENLTPNAYLVEANAGGRDFAVWAADISRANLSLDDLASETSENVSKGLDATPSIQAYASTSEGVMGREFTFTKDAKWQATVRVFVAGGRAYQVIAKSAFGQDDPAVSDFLSSFHTLGGAPAANSAATNSP